MSLCLPSSSTFLIDFVSFLNYCNNADCQLFKLSYKKSFGSVSYHVGKQTLEVKTFKHFKLVNQLTF